MLQQAVEGTKSLDDAKLGDYIRANTFKTMVGDVKFGAKGEWEKSRVLQVQFQNIKGNDVAQFKDMSTQVVVAPAEYKSGKVIYPVREGEVGAVSALIRRCAQRARIEGCGAALLSMTLIASCRLQPQIKLPDQLVVVELVGRAALEGDLAVHDDVAAVGDADRLR